MNSTNLYNAKPTEMLQITYIPNIGMLEGLGLRYGTKLKIQNKYVFGGPVLLRVEEAFSIALGKDIATQIGVEEVVYS